MNDLLELTDSEQADIQAYFDLLKNKIKPIVKKLDSRLIKLYNELGEAEDDKLIDELCKKVDDFKYECQRLGFHSSMNPRNTHVSL